MFLPFLAMLAVQLLVQNLLYDTSQLVIPRDRTDPEYLHRPRNGTPRTCAGSCCASDRPARSSASPPSWSCGSSSNADTGTAAPLFQSGWFVEGLLSQTLILHTLRTQKVPFLQSLATPPMIALTGVIMAIGIYLSFSPAAPTLGLVALPWTYFPILTLTLLAYCTVVQLAKRAHLRRHRMWL